jgi:thioesterase domain-containing protein
MKTDLLSLAGEVAKKLPSKPPVPGLVDPSRGLVAMLDAWQSYRQTREVEETKRTAIRARAEIEITRLKEQAQLMREYFQTIFAERRENFDRSFNLLEAGLAKGDDRQIEAALTMIVTLVKESPIRQAADAMRAIRERQEGEIIDL